MYTVSKGPSKIVHKTRRGISQNLDRLDNSRDFSKKWIENQSEPSSPDDWTIRIDKPVFHKKSSSMRAQQEVISPQHEEIIKFIQESWSSVCKECDKENGESSQSQQDNGESHISKLNNIRDIENVRRNLSHKFSNVKICPSIVYYKENEPNHHLQDFKPFDLESWWGKRLFNTITKSIP